MRARSVAPGLSQSSSSRQSECGTISTPEEKFEERRDHERSSPSRTFQPHPPGSRVRAPGFQAGYYDLIEKRVVIVPFAKLVAPPDDQHAFMIIDEEGTGHAIPFHLVRDIYCDGEQMWHRERSRA